MQTRTHEKSPQKIHGFARSPCPIANTLERIGDKWSLLVIRDLLGGERTYGRLLDSPEGIPTNILADRLKRLEESGIIVRSPYQTNPVRYAYALTERGKDFAQVLDALVRWGKNTYTVHARAPSRQNPLRRKHPWFAKRLKKKHSVALYLWNPPNSVGWRPGKWKFSIISATTIDEVCA